MTSGEGVNVIGETWFSWVVSVTNQPCKWREQKKKKKVTYISFNEVALSLIATEPKVQAGAESEP